MKQVVLRESYWNLHVVTVIDPGQITQETISQLRLDYLDEVRIYCAWIVLGLDNKGRQCYNIVMFLIFILDGGRECIQPIGNFITKRNVCSSVETRHTFVNRIMVCRVPISYLD